MRPARRLACSALLALVVAACGSGAETAPQSGEARTGETREPPARVIALTADGDVVVVNRVALTREATLASFQKHEDSETGLIYGQAEDLTPLPAGRALVSTCCEPAGGAIYLLTEGGERSEQVSGWDPQVDPTGKRVAIGGITGIAIWDASLGHRPRRALNGDPAEMPEDPAWSPDGRALAFTSGGRLGSVPAKARSLSEAKLLEPREGTYWSSPAYTAQGIVAVERRGAWPSPDRSGPSRLTSVDLATAEVVELASSSGPITDVSVDETGQHLLWVDDGRLRWRIDGVTSEFPGNFVAAAWLP